MIPINDCHTLSPSCKTSSVLSHGISYHTSYHSLSTLPFRMGYSFSLPVISGTVYITFPCKKSYAYMSPIEKTEYLRSIIDYIRIYNHNLLPFCIILYFFYLYIDNYLFQIYFPFFYISSIFRIFYNFFYDYYLFLYLIYILNFL